MVSGDVGDDATIVCACVHYYHSNGRRSFLSVSKSDCLNSEQSIVKTTTQLSLSLTILLSSVRKLKREKKGRNSTNLVPVRYRQSEWVRASDQEWKKQLENRRRRHATNERLKSTCMQWSSTSMHFIEDSIRSLRAHQTIDTQHQMRKNKSEANDDAARVKKRTKENGNAEKNEGISEAFGENANETPNQIVIKLPRALNHFVAIQKQEEHART